MHWMQLIWQSSLLINSSLKLIWPQRCFLFPIFWRKTTLFAWADVFSYGLFVQLRHGYLESICGPRVRPSCSTTDLLLGQSPHIRTVLNRGMKFFNISFLVLLFHKNLTRNWVVALVSERYIHYYYYPLQSIHPSPNFLLRSSPDTSPFQKRSNLP